MKLTDASIRTITLPADKNDLITFDDKLQGFGLRLRRAASGIRRQWIVQYRDAAGESRRFLIGTVDELNAAKARAIAADKLAGIRLGTYPHDERVKARSLALETFEAVAELYLANRRANLRPRSFVEVERHIRKRWAPFCRTSVHQIERRAIALRVTEIAAQNGPTEANRARATLSAMFAWAMREGIVEQNPVIATNKAADEVSRDRVLTDVELADIWGQCGKDDYGRIIRLLVLTGQRREEVGAMTWDEIDLERGLWSLGAERTKNKHPHTVPLAPMAIAIIKSVSRRDAGTTVFGEGANGFMGWSASKAKLDKKIAEARAQAGRGPMPAWRVHDIRRTFATGLAELGVVPHIIEAVLNHRSGHKAGVAGVYNKALYEREARNALLMWAEHVRTITDGGDRKVIPMRPKEVPA